MDFIGHRVNLRDHKVNQVISVDFKRFHIISIDFKGLTQAVEATSALDMSVGAVIIRDYPP